jgi:hypothetical protein
MSAQMDVLAGRVSTVEGDTANHSNAIAALTTGLNAVQNATDGVRAGVADQFNASAAALDALDARVEVLKNEVTEAGDGIVANYRTDIGINLKADAPDDMNGWSYLWNPTEAVGTRAAYQPLFKSTRDGSAWDKGVGALHFRTTESGDTYPSEAPARYLNMDGLGGHVGAGSASATNTDDRCNIAGYSVPEDHIYSITNSFLHSTNQGILDDIVDGFGALDGMAVRGAPFKQIFSRLLQLSSF